MSAGEGGAVRPGYMVEVRGEVREVCQPFVIGVLADLSGAAPEHRPAWADRRFLDVDREGLAGLRAELGGDGADRSWSGLELLLAAVDPADDVKVRVLDASRAELRGMLREYSGKTWDQSPLFREICNRPYGDFGAEPFSLLVADYRLLDADADAAIREGIERLGEAAAAPVLWPAECRSAEEIYAFAAEIGRRFQADGWFAGLAEPDWADEAGLDLERLRRLLCSGPFLRHVKAIVRDKIGNFRRTADMAKWLNAWLGQYVASGPEELSPARPVLEAEVRVVSADPHPGVCRVELTVAPALGFAEPGPPLVLRTALPGATEA